MTKIFIADDDTDMCMLLSRFLTRNGFEVAYANSGRSAMNWLNKNRPALALCDFRLEDITGAELLSKIKKKYPEVPVIIITGYSDVKDAVEVMKMGAFDYVTKPLYPDEILLTIKNALASAKPGIPGSVPDSPARSTDETGLVNHEEYIIGNSTEFNNLQKQIDLVAPTNYSVILYGESGSGKEVVARQIHQKSKRAAMPFIAIDCGALSKELAGSELFGHEKGSFTGATAQKQGSLETANGGTIFLDEISNLTYEVQISLLRVVQERKIRRVGGLKDIDLNVRIIVACNENLWEAARAGKFREDLYHRFNEFSIVVPALRERKNDIMLFANHFLKITNLELGKNVLGFSNEVEDIFKNYIWYGNLREMKNVIKRAVLLSDGDFVEVKTLPFEINNFKKLQFENTVQSTQSGAKFLPPTSSEDKLSLEGKYKSANIEAEYQVILDALKQTDFNKSKAAALLNIDRKTLYNKMKQYKVLSCPEIG